MAFGTPCLSAELDWGIEKIGSRGEAHILIRGPIQQGDEVHFARVATSLLDQGFYPSGVRIYSPGGSVNAAMHIGRQIRELGLTTIAPRREHAADTPAPKHVVTCEALGRDRDGHFRSGESAKGWSKGLHGRFPEYREDPRTCTCTSACFLIWAAGRQRFGTFVGLHRPYFDRAEFARLSLPDATAVYDREAKSVKDYLGEMDVPKTIFDKMMNASSEDMYFLDDQDLHSLHRPSEHRNDAAEEYAIAKCGSFDPLYARQTEIDVVLGRRQCGASCAHLHREQSDILKRINELYACRKLVEFNARLPQYEAWAVRYRALFPVP
jgi:hypothetical protein